MKRRFPIALVVLAIFVTAVFVFTALQPDKSDPVYNGRPLSYWVIHCLYPQLNRQGVLDMEAAFQAQGTNAVPTLLRLLQATDSDLKVNVFALLQKQRLIKFSYIPASTKNGAAGYGIAKLGTNAWAAIPSLLEIYEKNISTSSRSSAAYALGALGPASSRAVPTFLRMLNDTNSDIRFDAIHALGMIHAEPASVVPELLKCTQNKDRRTRMAAMSALRKFGADASNAVPALTAILQTTRTNSPSPDYQMVFQAAEILGTIGPPAASAVPTLSQLLEKPDPFLRAQSAIALWRINSNPEVCLPVLSQAFPQLSKDDRWTLLLQLADMGPRARDAFPLLTNELNNDDGSNRDTLIFTLKAIDPEAAAKAGIK